MQNYSLVLSGVSCKWFKEFNLVWLLRLKRFLSLLLHITWDLFCWWNMAVVAILSFPCGWGCLKALRHQPDYRSSDSLGRSVTWSVWCVLCDWPSSKPSVIFSSRRCSFQLIAHVESAITKLVRLPFLARLSDDRQSGWCLRAIRIISNIINSLLEHGCSPHPSFFIVHCFCFCWRT